MMILNRGLYFLTALTKKRSAGMGHPGAPHLDLDNAVQRALVKTG